MNFFFFFSCSLIMCEMSVKRLCAIGKIYFAKMATHRFLFKVFKLIFMRWWDIHITHETHNMEKLNWNMRCVKWSIAIVASFKIQRQTHTHYTMHTNNPMYVNINLLYFFFFRVQIIAKRVWKMMCVKFFSHPLRWYMYILFIHREDYSLSGLLINIKLCILHLAL